MFIGGFTPTGFSAFQEYFRINALLLLAFYLDHFLAFVGATSRTQGMGQFELVTSRTSFSWRRRNREMA